MNTRNLLAAATLGVFFVLISLFFVGVPWPSETHDVPLFGPSGPSVAGELFTTYAVTLILIALLLSSAMIGGVYLAKREEKP